MTPDRSIFAGPRLVSTDDELVELYAQWVTAKDAVLPLIRLTDAAQTAFNEAKRAGHSVAQARSAWEAADTAQRQASDEEWEAALRIGRVCASGPRGGVIKIRVAAHCANLFRQPLTKLEDDDQEKFLIVSALADAERLLGGA